MASAKKSSETVSPAPEQQASRSKGMKPLVNDRPLLAFRCVPLPDTYGVALLVRQVVAMLIRMPHGRRPSTSSDEESARNAWRNCASWSASSTTMS